jgi:hypothetical protein|tara:strand:+ start:404 stop:616 length:213 start_codon:yes stop_codon:yes gene_type:complete
MNYDKKVIQYAVTRILTDQKYKEKNKQWAKEQLQRALNNTDITTRKELVFAIDNILKYEFGLTNMFHVKH